MMIKKERPVNDFKIKEIGDLSDKQLETAMHYVRREQERRRKGITNNNLGEFNDSEDMRELMELYSKSRGLRYYRPKVRVELSSHVWLDLDVSDENCYFEGNKEIAHVEMCGEVMEEKLIEEALKGTEYHVARLKYEKESDNFYNKLWEASRKYDVDGEDVLNLLKKRCV